ncbi:MAG: ribosome biogenesis GTP-binding protein YihA/YsxC [Gammaproteobacteria bacterium]|jgi:GTP-binding protein|nr:ribosome biogenesis GTP-binding protein YihA/YsxC [Gammaproteobacteria bacterium]
MNPSRYRNAKYLNAVHLMRQLPQDSGIEVAFAGRSNAGKSSVINRLCGQTGLAKTSRSPGRTRQIVLFTLDEQRLLVDLPGYGYAKVSRDLKQHWQQLLDDYLSQREALRGMILVMDIRHPLKEFDQNMISWLQQAQLPGHILLNKADKLNRQHQVNALREVSDYVAKRETDISVQLFSALKSVGVAELEQRLDEWYQWHIPTHE